MKVINLSQVRERTGVKEYGSTPSPEEYADGKEEIVSYLHAARPYLGQRKH